MTMLISILYQRVDGAILRLQFFEIILFLMLSWFYMVQILSPTPALH